MPILIKTITPLAKINNPIIFIALKRVCECLRDNIWTSNVMFDDKIEAATYEVAVDNSKKFEKDILELADMDTELDWGCEKVTSGDKFSAIKFVGNFNPWYAGSLTLEELFDSLSGLWGNYPYMPGGIELAEFNHYYDFLHDYLWSIQPSSALEKPFNEISLKDLHPRILEVSKGLFKDKYYAQAVLEAYKLVNDEVKARAGLPNYDGKSLMEHAFSIQHPKIQLNNLSSTSDKDEQLGFMLMFSGAIVGIRNPKAHDILVLRDRKRALQYLIFASLLLERLDEAVSPAQYLAEH